MRQFEHGEAGMHVNAKKFITSNLFIYLIFRYIRTIIILLHVILS